MLDPYGGRVEPERFALHLGSVNELSRSDKYPWKTSSFKVCDVMHTA